MKSQTHQTFLDLSLLLKHFDHDKGNACTVFMDSSDLLDDAEDASPNADAIVSCLAKMLHRLGLDLADLKAFTSDDASVIIIIRYISNL